MAITTTWYRRVSHPQPREGMHAARISPPDMTDSTHGHHQPAHCWRSAPANLHRPSSIFWTTAGPSLTTHPTCVVWLASPSGRGRGGLAGPPSPRTPCAAHLLSGCGSSLSRCDSTALAPCATAQCTTLPGALQLPKSSQASSSGYSFTSAIASPAWSAATSSDSRHTASAEATRPPRSRRVPMQFPMLAPEVAWSPWWRSTASGGAAAQVIKIPPGTKGVGRSDKCRRPTSSRRGRLRRRREGRQRRGGGMCVPDEANPRTRRHACTSRSRELARRTGRRRRAAFARCRCADAFWCPRARVSSPCTQSSAPRPDDAAIESEDQARRAAHAPLGRWVSGWRRGLPPYPRGGEGRMAASDGARLPHRPAYTKALFPRPVVGHGSARAGRHGITPPPHPPPPPPQQPLKPQPAAALQCPMRGTLGKPAAGGTPRTRDGRELLRGGTGALPSSTRLSRTIASAPAPARSTVMQQRRGSPPGPLPPSPSHGDPRQPHASFARALDPGDEAPRRSMQ
eukprot:356781-Chlamydomonas_euryale.AAC.9